MPAPWAVLIVVLWSIVIMLAVMVLGLSRRIQHLQSASLPVTVPRPARTGPTVGELAPAVPGYEELDHKRLDQRARVALFLNSSCGMCRRVAEELRSSTAHPEQHNRLEDIELVLVTDPLWPEPLTDLGSLVVTETDRRLSEAWRVPGTPYAVAIADDGTVRAASFISGLADVCAIAATLPAVSTA
jgi:hypothetical protein